MEKLCIMSGLSMKRWGLVEKRGCREVSYIPSAEILYFESLVLDSLPVAADPDVTVSHKVLYFVDY